MFLISRINKITIKNNINGATLKYFKETVGHYTGDFHISTLLILY